MFLFHEPWVGWEAGIIADRLLSRSINPPTGWYAVNAELSMLQRLSDARLEGRRILAILSRFSGQSGR